MKKLFDFLGSDKIIYVGSALTAVALAVKGIAASHTVAYHVADAYLGFAIAHGLASTAAKASK